MLVLKLLIMGVLASPVEQEKQGCISVTDVL